MNTEQIGRFLSALERIADALERAYPEPIPERRETDAPGRPGPKYMQAVRELLTERRRADLLDMQIPKGPYR